ncbi:probable LRR receptor-like serine/threonine-protein kinase At1g53420 isoform X2 [Lycium barbarum]|uniref:probable LRR receptor-like serine/threonine-protein kinase At1g53420 isoform X2 n=1 Tax=Lycium barbarum TaxID=112863 RepID=UPI00293E644C|nr:probable LRR receptor-like serine/threonine-protein kinase At1g53420 isoform X2 [Lycium barbarum]
MAMFMYVYRVSVSLLLLLVLCERTVEQAARGPLSKICTTTWYDTSLTTIPPLAEEDEDAIKALLGCSSSKILRPNCYIGFTNAVTCNCYPEKHKRCRVVQIDFSNRRLEGKIPKEIGDLQYLESLYLNGNNLRGSIPEPFKNLKNLVNLSLCDNSLEGPIPPFFGEMKSLKSIDLCKNFFDQIIPPELGSLPSLENLDLGHNFLSGKIPEELGNIKSLIRLYLVDNQLSGVLPVRLGDLMNLEELNLQNNEFIGALPPSFKSLKKLTYFDVRGNKLNETIPDIFELWQDLRILNLMGNSFSAPLPGQISKLKNLTELHISDLVGKSYSFPDLSRMEFLRILTLRNCSIDANIPIWIWKLFRLQYLDLSFNSLFGAIPEVVNSSLNYIFLRRNKLNDTIPSWMNATSYVDVSENRFKNVRTSSKEYLNPNLNLFACCPNEKDEVAKRDQVDFHFKNGTQFCTQFYDHLYINCGGDSVPVNGNDYEADVHPRGESTFFMSKRSNWGYSSMGSFLWANRNKYTLNETGEIHAGDAQLYRTARLSPISLKYYGFCLRNGEYKVKLHFAEISSSNTKDSHSKAGRLFDVDIQEENVLRNFNIEREAKGVNKAITMEYPTSVNEGRLEIHLYWSGKGSVLCPSGYYGPLISAITVTPVQSELSKGVLVGISGFALLLLILFIGFSWRFQDKLRREELEVVELYPGGHYNFRKIKAATKNFGDENRFGEGGFGTVYKGTLANGTDIAVKKLLATKEEMHEFVEKSHTIAGMKHPNLATLMGCCAGDNELMGCCAGDNELMGCFAGDNELMGCFAGDNELMGCRAGDNELLLIYEYIGTNSVEDALFDSDELRERLDWPTRYRICLGLAEGLAFLHEGSKLEIIHGDIKPANIILDDDLNPKIYDFGFAKLHHKQKLEGTLSYTAPEVKDHPLEASADVYSFGVVTLILISGRKVTTPRAGGDTEYLVEEAQVKDQRGTLMDLVDNQLLEYDWEEADIILRLAMKCISSRPFRPTMSTVVKILKKECSIETIEPKLGDSPYRKTKSCLLF